MHIHLYITDIENKQDIIFTKSDYYNTRSNVMAGGNEERKR